MVAQLDGWCSASGGRSLHSRIGARKRKRWFAVKRFDVDNGVVHVERARGWRESADDFVAAAGVGVVTPVAPRQLTAAAAMAMPSSSPLVSTSASADDAERAM
jgi:hypothetical protein